MDEKLWALGLEKFELDAEHKRRLDEDGFTVFEGVLEAAWVEEMRGAFDEIFAREGADAGKEVSQMEGVRRLADLVNKGAVFDPVYLQPFLLAAVGHVLGRPFKLHSLNGHDPLPGGGQQALHADWGGERTRAHVVNSMWMLDAFTPENGATRLVPATHRTHREGKITDYVEDRMAPHPDEVRLVGPAGSVGIFNGNVWHSSCANHNGQRRRTLHCAFIAREHAQQTDQRRYLRPETEARLTPLARYVLDV